MEKVVKKSAYETPQTDIVLIQTEGCIAQSTPGNNLPGMPGNSIYDEDF